MLSDFYHFLERIFYDFINPAQVGTAFSARGVFQA